MPWFKWSQTASANANADSTINWAEGQAPSSVNDSARAMMAATAMYRDDVAGAIVTAGTSTAYTVSSFSGFDTLAHLNGQMIAFTPHTTGSATITLNVDNLGAKPLRTSPGVELVAGMLIQGTPYVATYNNTDGAFYLRGFLNNPYCIPIAASMPFWGLTPPNSCFAFPFGQAISRTAYPAAFAAMGTNYGAGDGSSTFNLPDARGRVVAAMDNMGGTAAGRLSVNYFGANTGFAATSLGAYGGLESHTLTAAEIPPVPFSATTGTESQGHTHGGVVVGANTYGGGGSGTTFVQSLVPGSSTNESQSHVHAVSGTISGGGNPHAVVQPTIVGNHIIRIL